MGAFDFRCVGSGKTAEQAFNTLRENDLFENGHDPYSGSIGQKYGFVLMATSPMTLAQAQKLIDSGDPYSTPKKGDEVAVSYFASKKRGWVEFTGTVVARSGRRFRVQPTSARWQDPATPVLLPENADIRRVVSGAMNDVQDKWGPAGCIPLKGRKFLFFGWAAS